MTFYTMSSDEPKLKGAAGFGEQMLRSNEIPAIHFINMQNHWWQIPDIQECLQVGRDWLQGAQSRRGYGASMGAYACLNFSRDLDLDAVLGFSPQYSVDGTKVPWEKRWRGPARKLEFTHDDLIIREGCSAHIIYDSLIDDRMHAELIATRGHVNLYKTDGGGHTVIDRFSRAGLLKPLVKAYLSGTFDAGIVEKFNAEHGQTGKQPSEP